VVQNAAEAESVAIASGLHRFLTRVRGGDLPGPDAAPAAQLVVILVAEDEGRLSQPLLRLRGIGGVATLVVRSDGGMPDSANASLHRSRRSHTRSAHGFRGADVELSWDAVMHGLQSGV
jgi:hypothetical protein